MSNAPAPAGSPDLSAKPSDGAKSIYLISYPKIVFLYPTFLTALIAGIYMAIVGPEQSTGTVFTAWAFLLVLAINMVVLSFDFPRATWLTLFFFIVAVVIGLWFLFYTRPNLLPFVTETITKMKPLANATFYFVFVGVMGLIYIGVLVNIQFDYWEIRANELLHHHGILSDLERFSAPSLRIDKEINDVFEYVLLRSGRLILHPSQERRAIVLENVVGINRKEAQITQMLGALQVQVRAT